MTLAIIWTFYSCIKSNPAYMNNAKITGIDMRMCPTPCCGGFEITIDNVPVPNSGSYFFVAQMPDGFNVGNNPKFPIPVSIDWKMDSTHCQGNFIDITRIEKRQ